MKIAILFLFSVISGNLVWSQSEYLHASANGRYLQWNKSKPFYINACTAWSLVNEYTEDEAVEYLKNRITGKFNTIQISALYTENDKTHLDKAFINGDFLQPVADYWNSAEKRIRLATDLGLVVVLNPIWLNSSNELLKLNGPEKCRKFGQWFAGRFKSNNRIVYVLGGNINTEFVKTELEEMGKGIQDVYGGKAILGIYGEAGKSGFETFTGAAWITLNYLNTNHLSAKPYSVNYENWKKYPKTPLFFGEGVSDSGNSDIGGNSENEGTRFSVRRQAWWTLLSGSSGNGYTAEGIKNKNRNGQIWQNCIQYPSGKDRSVLMQFLEKTRWSLLQPDTEHQILTGGNGSFGSNNYALCASTENNSLIVVYSPVKQTLELSFPDYGKYRFRWFDPTSGKYNEQVITYFKRKGKSFLISTPEANNSGFEDWVLVMDKSSR